jgi:hypothetical protein
MTVDDRDDPNVVDLRELFFSLKRNDKKGRETLYDLAEEMNYVIIQGDKKTSLYGVFKKEYWK